MADREHNERLLRLVAENPDLPIVAMVDCDIVCEDYGRWLASFGMCYVGEYALYEDRYYDDREEFKEAYYDYNDEPLCEKFGYDPRIGEYQFKIGECTKEEWIDRDEKTWCSNCDASNKQYKPPYCPHCGAKMYGGKHETD